MGRRWGCPNDQNSDRGIETASKASVNAGFNAVRTTRIPTEELKLMQSLDILVITSCPNDQNSDRGIETMDGQ